MYNNGISKFCIKCTLTGLSLVLLLVNLRPELMLNTTYCLICTFAKEERRTFK